MKLVTVIGDSTLDLVSLPFQKLPKEDTEAFTSFDYKVGGQAAHCALGLAKLGIKTEFITCLGEDYFGERILRKLKEAKNLHVQVQKKTKTALSVIIPTKHKRTILNDPGANALFSGVDLKQINGDCLFIGGFWHLKLNLIKIMRYAKKKGMSIFLDTGYTPKPNLQKLFKVLKYVDYLLVDKKEILLYTRQKKIGQALKRIGCKVGLHFGKEGSAFYTEGTFVKVPVRKVYVGETTGAGDFWNAAFIYGMIRGLGLEKNLGFANEFAIKCLKGDIHKL